MMIEDEELRELYKTSSSEHLAKLESDLMILEKNPQDTAAIEEFLREAHTLKGDSRMLGLNDIEMLVHHLEDCVEGIKAGKGEITPELCDRLYQGIDAINQLSHQAITGEAVAVNTFEVLASLMGVSDVSQSTGNSEADLFEDSDFKTSLFDDNDHIDLSNEADAEKTLAAKLELAPDPFIVKNSQPAVAAPIKDYSIETIRVEPQKLDTLMTHANELTVTKLRISHQMTEINQMLDLWSQWHKDSSQNRSVLDQIESNLTPEQLQPLKYFFNTAQQHWESFGNLVNYLKIRANEDINSLNLIADRLESGIQELRQLPLSDVFNLFPRMVRDLAKQQGKEINLVIEGGDTKADKKILEEIKDPLLHLIRNAIDHGIEIPEERMSKGKPSTATLVLRGYQTGNSIGVEIRDDGRGLDLDSIKNTAIRRQVRTEAELAKMSEDEIQSLIFASGFSTRTEITELSGRGVGLDVVRANVERLKGSIQVSSTSGNGCQFKIRLGSSLVATRVLIVEEAKNLYAIPVEYIANMLAIAIDDIYTIDGSEVINYENRPISLARLGTLLKLPTANQTQTVGTANKLFAIVLTSAQEYFCLIVNAFIDRQDITFKPQSKLLKRIPNIAGATILGNGEVCMVLNPNDLLHSLKNGTWHSISSSANLSAKNKLLLVEDSMIIRTQMQRLLKNAGYDVTVAVNGLAGLQKIQTQEFDIVLSDIEMPQMNGLEMIANIRQNDQYNQLPIVLITTLASPEDKQRGMDTGANAYLTKGDFDQQILLQTLERLVNHNN
ncbi:MAG: response regulator [Pleurocapsa sp.]